jgi:hypothetical protein
MPRLIRRRGPAAALLGAAAALGVTLAVTAAGHTFSPHAGVAHTHAAFGAGHTSDGSATALGYFRPGCSSSTSPDGCGGSKLPVNCSILIDPNGCGGATSR